MKNSFRKQNLLDYHLSVRLQECNNFIHSVSTLWCNIKPNNIIKTWNRFTFGNTTQSHLAAWLNTEWSMFLLYCQTAQPVYPIKHVRTDGCEYHCKFTCQLWKKKYFVSINRLWSDSWVSVDCCADLDLFTDFLFLSRVHSCWLIMKVRLSWRWWLLQPTPPSLIDSTHWLDEYLAALCMIHRNRCRLEGSFYGWMS